MASQNIDPLATTSSSEHIKTASEYGKTESSCHSVQKRLQQELMKLMLSGEKGVSAFPTENNIFHWIATIQGAVGTVYEGLTYKLRLEIPNNYPYTAPTVRFTTPCFHPNVDDCGNICLDILKDKWTALYDIRAILLSIQSLLGEPNVSSPLNAEAARLWKNQEAYKKVLHENYNRDVRKKQQSL